MVLFWITPRVLVPVALASIAIVVLGAVTLTLV